MISTENEIRDALQRTYKNKNWGKQDSEDGGSLSGNGSGIKINRVRVGAISEFSKNMGVQRIIDVGCGDCAWQKGFVDRLPHTVDYHGLDVAALAVEKARATCSNTHRMTIHGPIDASSEQGHKLIAGLSSQHVVLAIVKEAIQHIPLENGVRLLRNLKHAGVQFLAITHHDKSLFPHAGNKSVKPGGMYENDMFEPPFLFKSPLADTNNLLKNKMDKRSMGNLMFFNLQNQSL